MLIIPAIDLLGGKVVRLVQGDEKKAIVYSGRPLEIAREFQSAGVKWIHVVDLDGAFGRFNVNDSAIEELLRGVPVPIELGGGIRSLDRIEHWLIKGVARVILGSAAVVNPDLVRNAVRKFGTGTVVAGLDLKDGRIAIHGWKEATPVPYLDLAREMETAGVSRAVVTDISSDGMLLGPRLDATFDIARKTGLNVIVSGGISEIRDLRVIAAKNVRGIEGVIVGKAMYEKKLDLREAVRDFQEKTND